MGYSCIYDKILTIDGIVSVSHQSGNIIELAINGDNTDYYRQLFQDYILIRYLYLNYEPVPSLILKDCKIDRMSVEKVYNKYGIYVKFSFKELVTNEEYCRIVRSIKLKKIINGGRK